MKNILTFDLEDWYHGNFLFDEDNETGRVDRVREPTDKILDMLKKTGNTATFFVLGSVAEKHPELIKEIFDQGHEIASHSYDHHLVYNMNARQFSDDLKKSINVLKRIVGDEIIGYRAPYWSIYQDMDWVWEVLKQNGIIYDSSVYPFKTYLYGDSSVPRFRYDLNCNQNGSLIEIPPSTLEISGKRIPFCGGFYFRVLPYWVVKWGINRINHTEKQPAVFYLHPYEIDTNKPKSSKGFKNNFILHANIKKAEKKLYKLLSDFEFVSMKNYLKETKKNNS